MERCLAREDRYDLKTLFIVILLLLSLHSSAQLSLSVSTDKQGYKAGEVCSATITARNDAQPEPPFAISATAQWVSAGVTQSTYATSELLSVSRALMLTSVSLDIPEALAYVPGSANVAGTAIEASVDGGRLSVVLGSELAEQSSLNVDMQFEVR